MAAQPGQGACFILRVSLAAVGPRLDDFATAVSQLAPAVVLSASADVSSRLVTNAVAQDNAILIVQENGGLFSRGCGAANRRATFLGMAGCDFSRAEATRGLLSSPVACLRGPLPNVASAVRYLLDEGCVYVADTLLTQAQQYLLGSVFEGEQSFASAAALYTQAAERGHAAAQTSLSILHYHGDGVPRSYERAAELLHRAVAGGDVDALSLLAQLYCDGDGVPRSYERAVELWQRAAEHGEAFAMEALQRAAGRTFMSEACAAGTAAWALCQAAISAGEVAALCRTAEDAVDHISAEQLEDGGEAYILNGTSNVLSEASLRKLYLTHSDGRQLDPFTRAPLVSVVKVRIALLPVLPKTSRAA